MLFTLWQLVRFNRKYPSAATLLIIVLTLLETAWVVQGVHLINRFTWANVDSRIRFLRIGALCAVTGQMGFCWVHARTESNRLRMAFTDFVAILFAAIAGIGAYGFVEPSTAPANYEESEWFLRPAYNAVYGWLTTIANVLFLFVVLILVKRHTELPDSVFSKRDKKMISSSLILFTASGILAALSVTITTFTSDLGFALELFLLSSDRLTISAGFLIIALQLARSPVLVLNMQGNMKSLLDEGVLGWHLAGMLDIGPSSVNYSTDFCERQNISFEERMMFSATSITAAGMGHTFGDASFLLPFTGHSDLVAVCISFRHAEPSIKDPRQEGKAPSVFALLIPMSLTGRLKSPIGIDEAVNKLKEQFTTLTSLSNPIAMEELTVEVLKEIL